MMSPLEETARRVNQLKELNEHAIPPDYCLHLQDWLSHQETENSGCPLLDTPFLITIDIND